LGKKQNQQETSYYWTIKPNWEFVAIQITDKPNQGQYQKSAESYCCPNLIMGEEYE